MTAEKHPVGGDKGAASSWEGTVRQTYQDVRPARCQSRFCISKCFEAKLPRRSTRQVACFTEAASLSPKQLPPMTAKPHKRRGRGKARHATNCDLGFLDHESGLGDDDRLRYLTDIDIRWFAE